MGRIAPQRRQPLRPGRRTGLSWQELVDRLPRMQADPGLWADLEWISEGTTDDLGPIV